MRKLRIVFMGTPSFAVGVLEKLIANHFEIVGVITAPDKPAGRGRKLSQSAVKKYALSEGLTVLQPKNLKDPEFLKELEALKANLQIVVAFRMLPKVVWQMPQYGTFNLHASLLPEYRGAAPINWAIINGSKETGVTTFFIDEKIDTGAIITAKSITVDDRETAGTLHDKLMELGASLVCETVDLIANDAATPIAQPKNVEFKEAPKLHPENTRINWNTTVQEIDRFIRGLAPYPVAWSQLDNGKELLKVKVYTANVKEKAHDLEPGTLFTKDRLLYVATINGFVIISELQLPGKKRMQSKDLLNGYKFDAAAKFV